MLLIIRTLLISLFVMTMKVMAACGVPDSSSQSNTNQNLVMYDIPNEANFGLGVWTRYQPYSITTNSIIQLPTTSTSLGDQAITTVGEHCLSLLDQNQQQYVVIAYFEYSQPTSIDLKFTMLTTNGIQQTIINQDIISFEGVWQYVYICSNLLDQKINTFVYNSIKDTATMSSIIGTTLMSTSNIFKAIIGGYGQLYESRTNELLKLSVFRGQFSNPIITTVFYSSTSDMVTASNACGQQYKLCDKIVETKLINNELVLNGTQKLDYTVQITDTSDIVINGWVKFGGLVSDRLIYRLLRIRQNKSYSEYQYQGDDLLVIEYIIKPDLLQVELVITTYSYVFPIKSEKIIDPTLVISQTLNYGQIIIWHYFSMIYNRFSTGTKNAKFILSIPQDQIYTIEWPNYIYHFTGTSVYYEVGGDQLSSNYYKGSVDQLSQLTCQSATYTFQLKCHYTCMTCSGPGQFNCLTCDPASFRTITPTHSCRCTTDYITIAGDVNCLKLTATTYVTLTRQPQTITQVLCQFGEFTIIRYGIAYCIKCPTLYVDGIITCGDCISYSNQWANNPKCSFDYVLNDPTTNSIYEIVYRTYPTIYTIDKASLTVQKCDGCAQFCEFTAINCYKYLYPSVGIDVYVQCTSGYSIKNGLCVQCVDNCNKCVGDICSECSSGFSYSSALLQCLPCDGEICTLNSQGNSIPSKCGTSFALVQSTCSRCGAKCITCQGYKDENRCVRCEVGYFISIDGYNCAQSIITNCQYEFQYISNTQSTIENLFDNNPLMEVVQSCGYCSTHKFDVATNSCVAQDITNCSYSIKLQNGTDKCLIGKASTTPIQQTDGCTLSNCSSCIMGYLVSGQEYCVECESGYYADLQRGICKQCPSTLNCKECKQQSLMAHDNMRQNILAFYKWFNPLGNYIQSQQRLIDSSEQVICISCTPSMELYNNQCIDKCPTDCLQCKHINNKNTCIRCVGEVTTIQSVINNQCMDCPSDCIACIPRTTDDILKFNALYAPSDQSLLKYSYQCIKPVAGITTSYWDHNVLMFFNSCSGTQCLNSVIIAIGVYCDINAYNTALASSADQAAFKRSNVHISMFSSTTADPIFNLQNRQFYDYLGSQRVQQLTIQYTLIPGTDLKCIFPDKAIISQTFSKNVYQLVNVGVTLTTININTLAIITNQLTIQDFKSVLFQNMIFQTQEFTKQSIIMTHISGVNFQILKAGITSVVSSKVNSIQFIIQNPLTIKVNQLGITNAYLTEISEIFKYYNINTFQQTKTDISISQLTIQSCTFSVTTIFRFPSMPNVTQTISMDNISVKDGQFINSQLATTDNSIVLVGSIAITLLSVDRVEISGAPLFDLNTQSNIVQQVALSNTKIHQQASVIRFNMINLVKLYASLLSIDQGWVLRNNNNTKADTSMMLFNDIQFQECYYKSGGAFINIQQNSMESTTVNIRTLKLVRNVIDLQTVDMVMNQNKSNIYIQTDRISLIETTIQRRYGFSELALIGAIKIDIITMRVTIDPAAFMLLHPSLVCLQSYSNKQMYSTVLHLQGCLTMNITDVRIDRLNSFDQALISIQGTQQSVISNLTMNNCNFTNNLLFITQSSVQASALMIYTEQQMQIKLQNINFINNTMNKFQQDQIQQSSATMLLQVQLATVEINQITFFQNLAFNTTDSILYVNAKQLNIRNAKFDNNNFFVYAYVSTIIAWAYKGTLYQDSIMSIYPIKSQSGNGYLFAESLLIQNANITNSFAQFGGGFYLKGKTTGQMTLLNCAFTNMLTSLSETSQSMGGSLFFSGKQSYLNIIINGLNITSSYSRTEGGSIYIEPSSQYNNIKIFNMNIKESYSLRGQVLAMHLTLESANSLIIMKNVQVANTKTGFSYFMGRMEKATSTEKLDLFSLGGLFLIQYGNVVMDKIIVSSAYYFGAIILYNSTSIQLKSVTIRDITDLQQSLIQLSLATSSLGNITIEKLLLENIIDAKTSTSDPTPIGFPKLIPQIYCTGNIGAPATLSAYAWRYTTMQSLNTAYLSKFERYQYRILSISGLSMVQKLTMKDVMMRQIKCTLCLGGLFSVHQITTQFFQFPKQVYIEQLSVINCTYSSGVKFSSAFFSQGSRLLEPISVPLESYKYNASYSIYLKDIVIANNIASTITAVGIYGVSVFAINMLVINNTATSGYMVQYYALLTQIYLLDTYILENSAGALSAGMDALEYQLPDMAVWKSKLALNTKTDKTGLNMNYNPQALTISVDGGITYLRTREYQVSEHSVIDTVDLAPYKIYGRKELVQYLMLPSGQDIPTYQYYDPFNETVIPYNLSLRLIQLNRYKEIQLNKGSWSYNCYVYTRISNISNPEENNPFTLLANLTMDDYKVETNMYDLNKLHITFDPYAAPELFLQLKFTCEAIIIPVFSEYPPYDYSETQSYDYELRVNVRTFNCQAGEFYKDNICYQCDGKQNQYQVKAGESRCELQDDISTAEVNSAMISLRMGYWRYEAQSQIIESCYHLVENCEGGWKYGDKSCALGHIGALCESCDLYDLRGSGQYSVSSQYSCGSCNEVQLNIVSIVLVSLWTIGCALITVQANIDDTAELLITMKIKAFGITSTKKSKSTILIKMFSNYLQIIYSVFTFQLSLPPEISLTANSMGNPIETMAYSLDCFLADMTDIDILYFHIVWMLLTPMFYIAIIYTGYLMLIVLKYSKYSVGVISTTLIYMYIYMQPNLIKGLISLMSRRNLSGVNFVQGNVAYLFDTYTHYKWLLSFIMPSLIIIAIIIPCFLFSKVHTHRKTLDGFHVRVKWGYLFNEYRKHAYFWETVKILQKQFIIIALSYYEDQITVKASLILLIVFLYQLFSFRMKPYFSVDLNSLDTLSTIVCSVSIIMMAAVHSAQLGGQDEIVWPFYIISGLLNIYFVLTLLTKIAMTYLEQYQEPLDRIRGFINRNFPHIVNRYPFLKPYLVIRREQSQRIQKHFAQIKEYLLKKARRQIEAKKRTRLQSKFIPERSQMASPSDSNQFMLGSPQLNQSSDRINSPASEEQIEVRIQKIYNFKPTRNQPNTRVEN